MPSIQIPYSSKSELLLRATDRKFSVINTILLRGSDSHLVIESESEARQIVSFLNYINHENELTFPYYYDDGPFYNETHQDKVNDFQFGTMTDIREALFDKYPNAFES